MVAVGDVIIRESKVGSIPDNTEGRPTTGWLVAETGDLAPNLIKTITTKANRAHLLREHAGNNTGTRCLGC